MERQPRNPKKESLLKRTFRAVTYAKYGERFASYGMRIAGLGLAGVGVSVAVSEKPKGANYDPLMTGGGITLFGATIAGFVTAASILEYRQDKRSASLAEQREAEQAQRPDTILSQQETVDKIAKKVKQLGRGGKRYITLDQQYVVYLHTDRHKLNRFGSDYYHVEIVDNVPDFERDGVHYFPSRNLFIHKEGFTHSASFKRDLEVKSANTQTKTHGVDDEELRSIEYHGSSATEPEALEVLSVIESLTKVDEIDYSGNKVREEKQKKKLTKKILDVVDELALRISVANNFETDSQASYTSTQMVFADDLNIVRIMRTTGRRKTDSMRVEVLSRVPQEKFFDERDRYRLVKQFQFIGRKGIPFFDYSEEEYFSDDEYNMDIEKHGANRPLEMKPTYDTNGRIVNFWGTPPLEELEILLETLNNQGEATLQRQRSF